MIKAETRKDTILSIFFIILSIVLFMLPTGFENKMAQNAVRCKGKIISVDNSEVQTIGLVKTGDQDVTLKLMDGPFKDQVLSASNPLLGQMDKDKIYKKGDTALVVLTLNEQGKIIFVNPQDHYRLGLEIFLLSLFAVLLIAYGGFTGLKALLSFLLTALVLWKVLVPLLLKGWDPILISLVVMASLSASIIFLVAGINRKGFTAFVGAFSGVLTSCAMAIYFTKVFHVHGAVMPFAETLLYSGFGHLNLTKIYIAAVFIACAGAVMDLAMDVAASMHEVVCTDPSITRWQAIKSGINVGRAVVGTMTTTLLLAYSGGFITLMMAFMAQGVPWVNTSNFIYVSAEILKTIVGSFGLVTVAPFTALVGGFLLVNSPEKADDRTEGMDGRAEPEPGPAVQ